MSRWYFLLLLILLSDLMAGAIIAYKLSQLTNGKQTTMVRYFALFFACYSFRGMCELFANASGYIVNPKYTTGFIGFFCTGKAAVVLSSWLLVAFLLRKGKLNDGPNSDH